MYPPPAPRPRSRFLAPLVALSAFLGVLVVAIVVVAIVKTGDGTPTGPRASGIDECVVGTWRVTSAEELVDIEGYGVVTFTGSGATLRLAPDGTGVTDYGSGTEFEGSANGSTVRLTLSGTVTFRYQTANEIMSFAEVVAKGTAVVSLDGTELDRVPLDGSDEPAKYTCSAERLSETSTNLYRVEMVRED